MNRIYCSECGGDSEIGCDCQVDEKPTVVRATLQDLMMSHKLDAETDDEYDTGKDW